MLATLMVLSLRIYHCQMAVLANLARFTGLCQDCQGCQKLPNQGFDFRGCGRKLVIIDVKN